MANKREAAAFVAAATSCSVFQHHCSVTPLGMNSTFEHRAVILCLNLQHNRGREGVPSFRPAAYPSTVSKGIKARLCGLQMIEGVLHFKTELYLRGCVTFEAKKTRAGHVLLH